MSDKQAIDYAALLLRLTLGTLLLLHAGLKIFVFTLPGTVQFFQSIGLPGPFAYVVILWEVLAGVALILGVWTRLAALIVIPDLLGAIVTVHFSAGFFFTNTGGGWEYLAFWIVALVVQALIGDGAFALRPWRPTNRLVASVN